MESLLREAYDELDELDDDEAALSKQAAPHTDPDRLLPTSAQASLEAQPPPPADALGLQQVGFWTWNSADAAMAAAVFEWTRA